tara:strand:- start:1013 stop:1195 length:183 start_codon:yes stop_codon:yes gene_type:complete
MFQAERDRDEVVVKSDKWFDVSQGEDGGTLVLTIREARRLSEALLEATMTVHLNLEPEDG